MKSESSLAGKIGKIALVTSIIASPLYTTGCTRFRKEMEILSNGLNYAITAPLSADPEKVKEYQENSDNHKYNQNEK